MLSKVAHTLHRYSTKYMQLSQDRGCLRIYRDAILHRDAINHHSQCDAVQPPLWTRCLHYAHIKIHLYVIQPLTLPPHVFQEPSIYAEGLILKEYRRNKLLLEVLRSTGGSQGWRICVAVIIFDDTFDYVYSVRILNNIFTKINVSNRLDKDSIEPCVGLKVPNNV